MSENQDSVVNEQLYDEKMKFELMICDFDIDEIRVY